MLERCFVATFDGLELPEINTHSRTIAARFDCADDERSLQEVMRTEIPQLGHEVVVCPDGRAAVKALLAPRNAMNAAVNGIKAWHLRDSIL